jgi:RimJ/RimL family protein N-acetyltransferase
VAPELVGTSVLLRGIRDEDVDAWLAGEDDEQVRWFEAPRPARREDVERAIAEWQASWAADGSVRQWAIVDRVTGELAGGVDLRLHGDGVVNLAYVVFPAWRRRRFATEAAELVFAYASSSLGTSTVRIKVLEGNVASLGVVARLGAALVGTETTEAGGTLLVHELRL